MPALKDNSRLELNPEELHILMLMRHGEYINPAPGDYSTDPELSLYGISQVKKAAATAIKEGYIPDAIVHSPVLRTTQTAKLMQEAFQEISKKEIPLIKASTLRVKHDPLNDDERKALFIIFGKETKVILAISHEPTIKALSGQLTGTKMRPSTAEIVVLEGHASDWQHFTSAQVKATFDSY